MSINQLKKQLPNTTPHAQLYKSFTQWLCNTTGFTTLSSFFTSTREGWREQWCTSDISSIKLSQWSWWGFMITKLVDIVTRVVWLTELLMMLLQFMMMAELKLTSVFSAITVFWCYSIFGCCFCSWLMAGLELASVISVMAGQVCWCYCICCRDVTSVHDDGRTRARKCSSWSAYILKLWRDRPFGKAVF